MGAMSMVCVVILTCSASMTWAADTSTTLQTSSAAPVSIQRSALNAPQVDQRVVDNVAEKAAADAAVAGTLTGGSGHPIIGPGSDNQDVRQSGDARTHYDKTVEVGGRTLNPPVLINNDVADEQRKKEEATRLKKQAGATGRWGVMDIVIATAVAVAVAGVIVAIRLH